MAINTLITLRDALQAFADGHGQIQRIYFGADDKRAPLLTDAELFPALYVAPIDVVVGQAHNTHRLRIYVYERLDSGASDEWENANDTSLILRDVRVWWNAYGIDDILISEDPTGQFKTDSELDNLVGYFAEFLFEIPSHGRCDVPVSIAPIPPPVCAPVTYNVEYANGDPIESGSEPSGGNIEVIVPNPVCAPASFTLVNTDATVLDSGTIASGGSQTITAPDGTVTIRRDGVFYATQAVRSNGSETVNVISAATTPKGQMPLKTWQTTPQGSGTDGDLEQGYGVSLLVLPYNNPFGTTERFTAPDGSQTYTDAIACDWLSWNDSTNTVLMIHFGSAPTQVLATNRSLSAAITYINGLTVGGYSGWNMINKNQLEFITENETSLNNLNYAPFNIGAVAIQTNTAYTATQRAVRATGGGMTLTTSTARTLAVRIGTVSGTVIS
jgi:hypothetical protein